MNSVGTPWNRIEPQFDKADNMNVVRNRDSDTLMRPSHEFWGTGKKGIFSGEQRSNFEGNRGTKTILGNRAHKKINFRFFGNRGTSQFISGEQRNRYPLGGPH